MHNANSSASFILNFKGIWKMASHKDIARVFILGAFPSVRIEKAVTMSDSQRNDRGKA